MKKRSSWPSMLWRYCSDTFRNIKECFPLWREKSWWIWKAAAAWRRPGRRCFIRPGKSKSFPGKRRNARAKAGSWKMSGRPWSPGRPWRFPWILRGRSGRRPSSGPFRELCPRSSSADWWRRLWRGTSEKELQTGRQLPGRRRLPAITPRWCPQTPTRAACSSW